MNEAFEQEYTALARMLKWESFRFVPVGHNRKSIYTDIASRIYSDFPDRNVQELRLGGKSYREIIDTIQQMDHGILLIPDFDWLLRKENDSVRAGFNQRRDLLAQLKIAFVCFIEPATYPPLPKKLPDWWSLRSLELDFKSDPYVRYNPLQTNDDPRNSLDIELKRLMIQLESTNQSEKLLLQSLYMNIAALLQGLNEYKDSIKYSQLGLEISL